MLSREKFGAHYMSIALALTIWAGDAIAWTPDGPIPFNLSTATSPTKPESECTAWWLSSLPHLLTDQGAVRCLSTSLNATSDWPRSVSLGSPARGALFHAEILSPNKFLTSRPNKWFGTRELVHMIERAVAIVNAEHPNSPVLHVGDLSRRHGGYFPPHKSHQSGLDVDIGYYLRRGHQPKHFVRANTRTVDVARSWTLMRSFLETEQVEYMFSDRRLMRLLRRHAYEEGMTDEAKLDKWFGVRGRGVIRHLKGHDDHLHIRIRAPESVAAISRLEVELGRKTVRRLMTPTPIYTKIRRGDSLGRIAARVGITQKKLRKFNRLRGRSPKIFAGKRLIIGYKYPTYKPQTRTTSQTARGYHRVRGQSKLRAKGKASAKTLRKKITPKRKASKRISGRVRTHTVRSGDSLYLLAKRYRVRIEELCERNRLAKRCAWRHIRKKPVHLKIGQKLRIPPR